MDTDAPIHPHPTRLVRPPLGPEALEFGVWEEWAGHLQLVAWNAEEGRDLEEEQSRVLAAQERIIIGGLGRNWIGAAVVSCRMGSGGSNGKGASRGVSVVERAVIPV